MKLTLLRCATVVALLAAASSWAARGHEHGVAQVDVALDGSKLSIQFESPLENLVGFERAPRNEAERRAVEQALARLADPALWQPDAAAQCKAGTPRVRAPSFQKGSPGQAGEHADVEAAVEFDCARVQELRAVQVLLFKSFPRLKRAEVQLATARGQAKATLRAATATITLPR